MPMTALHTLLDAAAELAWPTRCVGCELPGVLLCDECRERLEWVAQRWACPYCGAPFGYLTCTACRHEWEGPRVVAALSYDGIAGRMVRAYKDAHELRLAPVLAAAIAGALEEASGWEELQDATPKICLSDFDLLCFVPATPAAFARRGLDHMESVARHLAQMMGIPCVDVLARDAASDQRGLTRTERAANLEGTTSTLSDLAGARVLLVDDVVTTGASMRAATHAMVARGAREVVGCAVTRVW